MSRGFATIEVIIATVVFGIGALAVEAALLEQTRSWARGRVRARLALIAETRLATLRDAIRRAGSPCAAPAAGSVSHPGVVESWSIASAPGGVAVTLELRWSTARDRGADTVTALLSCP